MDIEITIALITLTGSAIGSVSGILISNKLTNYRIEKLEEEVKKYNQIKEKTYKLEQCYALHDEKLKVANHRIDDLEKRK